LLAPIESLPQPQPARLHGVALPVIAVGVTIALLYWGRIFFITSLTAIIIALILEPFVSLLAKLKIPRALGAFVVIGLAGAVLYLLTAAAWSEISGFSQELPKIGERVNVIVDNALDTVEAIEASTAKVFARKSKTPESPPAPKPTHKRSAAAKTPAVVVPGSIPEVRIHEERNPITDYIYARLGALYQYLLMASFVPFLVYFMLSWQEHLHRNFLHFFNPEARLTAARSLRGVGDLVRAFVVGNFLLGVLLAIASSIAFLVIGLPYPFLAGPASGFLSLVPYLGLPLALLFPSLLSFVSSGNVTQLVWIVIIVSALHLIALNLLYPKVVGARVHLNPLVVTFALMFWSFLWDGAGLILAIPLTAGIKAVCDNVRVLRPYGRFLGD
jgi:predicted PurR-regulated permease PerM